MRVVGIGASSGGLQALQTLLPRLTAGPTAFVVVVHLSPSHDSMLAHILSKSTPIPVNTATDGQVLQENCIYVIPPGFLLTLTAERTLRLTALTSTYPRWKIIDRFLTSLSEIGPTSIGVILSGSGSDGSRGLREIKARGGTTFVQDPESAEFPQMPQSARPFADHCLEPAALGDALMLTLRMQPNEPATLGPDREQLDR